MGEIMDEKCAYWHKTQKTNTQNITQKTHTTNTHTHKIFGKFPAHTVKGLRNQAGKKWIPQTQPWKHFLK